MAPTPQPAWATVQTGLAELVGDLSSLSVEWRDEPGQMHVDAFLRLDLIAPSMVGRDESRWADVHEDPENEESDVVSIEETMVGNREATLQITCKSPTQAIASSARAYLEIVRTSLGYSSTLERLRALNVGIVRLEPIQDVDPLEDGRTISQAVLDVRLAYLAVRTDAPIPFIETAHISSTAKNAGGVVLPDVLQQDLDPPEP
jgi:hypothetical protein